MLKKFLRLLLCLLYRVKVTGLENYHQAGERVLIIANHTSFLDPLLLGVFLPDDVSFAINTHISQHWWLRPFLGLSRVFPMDPTHPLSLKNLIHYLQTNTRTVIFPEGRITVTGSLMKVYDGTGMVADKAEAALLPVRIEGGQYTHFSRLHKKVRLRWFPKITMHILPATCISAPESLKGKARRQYCGQALADIMSDMMFQTSAYRQSIFKSLLDARVVHGGKHLLVEDLERKPISYDQLITRVLIISKHIAKITRPSEAVGVLLPNSSKNLLVILALQFIRRIPSMLNFSTGSAGMISACQIARVKTVLTSRRFLEAAHLTEAARQLSEEVQLIYLEDVAANISVLDKLTAYAQCKTADYWYSDKSFNADTPAVILFTSGSEGKPKGVVLSHANILGNLKQLQARISFNTQDVILNFLPMFHSFGFTAGSILPILNGIRVFFYPSPTHYSIIPEMAYELHATVIFGTNTFLAAYAKKAHPYDFFNARYVVAGAEKLQETTRQIWLDKFGIRILEGYGATETSPITSVNTPMYYKAGTVGRFMPGMDYKLKAVDGVAEGGELHVSGVNIMLGYMFAENPGVIVPTESAYGKGWYATGDIVRVDEQGFITICGRSKRFAKVCGEMVSLTAVESLAAKAWPHAQNAAVSVPDSKTGERVILLSTEKQASAAYLKQVSKGVAAILLPKQVLVVDAIPMAGVKFNYPAATELAKGLLESSQNEELMETV